MRVDTLGTNQPHIQDWMQRAEMLADPSLFAVDVRLQSQCWSQLSESEQTALTYRLGLVERWACYMAAGMMKGVLKYIHDSEVGIGQRPVGDWMSNLIGEGADVANYQMLLFDAWIRSGEIEKEDTP